MTVTREGTMNSNLYELVQNDFIAMNCKYVWVWLQFTVVAKYQYSIIAHLWHHPHIQIWNHPHFKKITVNLEWVK